MLTSSAWAQGSISGGQGAIISEIKGVATIETRGTEKNGILYDSVPAGSAIWVSTGSMLSLFLPDNSIVRYRGPVRVKVGVMREGEMTQPLNPIGDVVRGGPPSLPALSNLVNNEKDGAARALKTRVANTARFKATGAQVGRTLLTPRGLILSQTPSFRFLEKDSESLIFTLSPSNGGTPGRFFTFSPEKTYPYPGTSRPLERGCSYVIPEIGSASFTVLSSKGAEPIEAALGELKRDLTGSAGSLAQIRSLLQMGLPCDALDRIDEIQAEVGTNEYLLQLREEAYQLLSFDAVSERLAMDKVRARMRVNTIAANLLDQGAVSSSNGAFDFAVGHVSGGETLSAAPGAAIRSGSIMAFAVRTRRDMNLDLFLLDSSGRSQHLWPGNEEARLLNTGEVFYGGGDINWKLDEKRGLETFLMVERKEGQEGELRMEEWEGIAIRAASQAIIQSGSAELRSGWSGPLNDISIRGLKASGLGWAIIRIRHVG